MSALLKSVQNIVSLDSLTVECLTASDAGADRETQWLDVSHLRFLFEPGAYIEPNTITVYQPMSPVFNLVGRANNQPNFGCPEGPAAGNISVLHYVLVWLLT